MDWMTFHERWHARYADKKARAQRYKDDMDHARTIETQEAARRLYNGVLRQLDVLNAIRDDLHDLDPLDAGDLSKIKDVRVVSTFDYLHSQRARVLDVREEFVLVRFEHGGHDWVKRDRVIPVLEW